MFEGSPDRKNEEGKKIGEMSEEELLSEYEKLQDEVEHNIRRRNRIEKSGRSELAGDLYGSEYTAESTQRGVEYDFATLNAMRTEIEKRGLHAPTMEEREKKKLEESETEGRKPTNERKEDNEGMKVTVTYTLENWATHQARPVTMEFSGANLGEISDKVVRHLVGLEMNDRTEIATDTKIKTPNGDMTFEELAAASRK